MCSVIYFEIQNLELVNVHIVNMKTVVADLGQYENMYKFFLFKSFRVSNMYFKFTYFGLSFF